MSSTLGGEASETRQAVAARERGDLEIQDVSAWILRVGVVASVSVMVLGLLLALLRQSPTVAQMQSRRFELDFRAIAAGSLAGDGVALIQLGILLLVMTPIVRVASSMVLFAVEEKDWFYSGVTFVVLALTLISLLVLR